MDSSTLTNSGPPPWTAEQLWQVAADTRSSELKAKHGTVSRWRMGCGCQRCRAAHRAEMQAIRAAAHAPDWDDIGPRMIKEFADGGLYREVLAQMGISSRALNVQRARDRKFACALDRALMTGRDPALAHGRDAGWRTGCRCPDCRSYHESTRKPRPKTSLPTRSR